MGFKELSRTVSRGTRDDSVGRDDHCTGPFIETRSEREATNVA